MKSDHQCAQFVWRTLSVRTIVALVTVCISLQAGAQGLFDVIKGVGQAALQAATGASAPAQGLGVAPQQAQQPLQQLPVQRLNTGNASIDRALGPAQGAPMSPKMAALFQKGTVSGADLFDTLKEIRLEARASRTAESWAKAQAAIDSTVAQIDSGSLPSFDKLAGEVAFKFFEELLKTMAVNVAMQALDKMFQDLLDDKAALTAEKITLPAPLPGMTEAQAKRVVNMAAMIVAARITGRILESANKELEVLQRDYKALLDAREGAAEQLFALLDRRRALQRDPDDAAAREADATLRAALSQAEVRFLDEQLAGMKLDAFVKDMEAQNNALSVLKRLRPAQYNDYRVKADDVVARTRSYIQTVGGVAAFGGLLANFGKSMVELGREKNVPNLLQSLPLGLDFIRAAYPSAELAVKTSFNGFVLQPATLFFEVWKRPKAFVVRSGDKTEELADSAAVFAWLEKQGARENFSDSLFRGEGSGWLTGVLRCDADETGRMLDAAVPGEARAAFAKDYLGRDDGSGFNFISVFANPRSPRERDLRKTLIDKNHRREVRGGEAALRAVQNSVAERHNSWGNLQLIRLVIGNKEGARASSATLMVNSQVSIRPVPSPDSIFAFESHTESCRREEAANQERDRSAGMAGTGRATTPVARAPDQATPQEKPAVPNPAPRQPVKKAPVNKPVGTPK